MKIDQLIILQERPKRILANFLDPHFPQLKNNKKFQTGTVEFFVHLAFPVQNPKIDFNYIYKNFL